ncbi:MAG: ABC transporter ATP-binding protein/permease [Synergistaceae bacterium]|jgi:ATP-binding cassette subfamily B protein|nr:ABC transporter ATP-binding protein/permease [Synergistaceae bacterium]
MLLKFARYYRPHLKLFIFDMTCAFVTAVCNMFYPMITRRMINTYVPSRAMNMIAVWAAALLAVYVVKAAMVYSIQYYGHTMGVSIQLDIRRDAFGHLQRLPFSYFDRTQTGGIMSRIINDTFEIAELAHHGPEDLFLSIVLLIGSFVLLSTMDVALTVIIYAFIPILFFFAYRQRKNLSRTSMKSRAQIGEVNADLQNSIAGVRVAKAFETSEHERERFQSGNRSYARARNLQYKAMAEFSSGTGLIIDLLMLATLFAGGFFAYLGRIGPGEFTAYLLFAGLFTEPIKKLINFVEQLQTGMTGFVRIQELLAEPPEADTPGAVDLRDVRGAISFERVSFHYDGGERVLCDISIDIAPGETVALVGPSGGGKTTLCHLLPRFYEPYSGRVTIDGRNIREYTLYSLRGSIGIVQQDTYIFAGTIRDNIAYGDFEATDEMIRDAAEKAQIGEFIESLPEGFDTYVGERGVTLSGGQKQRIAIARIFLKNPRILILDEATSALDNATEVAIQCSLEKLSVGRTTIVVAHRLSTVRNADKIVVLTENGIEEEGTHEELVGRGGLYAMLWGGGKHPADKLARVSGA